MAGVLPRTTRRDATPHDADGRLLQRGANGPLLSAHEAQDAQRELETTRAAVEQLDAMLLLRRQQLRQM